jgi:transcriptional regulator with XRE-family HTH domain
MDAVRLGLAIRALRRRRRLTQRELAERCGLSTSAISRLERGGAGRSSLRSIDRAIEVLGARLHVRVLWQGEELDRLLDRDHAHLVEATLALLHASGWVGVPEVTFQVAGERGSIDILAHHASTQTLVVIEVKSVVPDVQATLAGLDRKARLAPGIPRDRAWRVSDVGRLLVVPADRTSRRRIEAFRTTFERALPARTAEVKRWLAAPSGRLAGILFLSDVHEAQSRQRVRHRRSPG